MDILICDYGSVPQPFTGRYGVHNGSVFVGPYFRSCIISDVIGVLREPKLRFSA